MIGRLPASRSPPAPNTTMSLPLRIRAQALKRFLQRVRLVRVVDEYRRAVAVADKLQPSLCAGEFFERGKHARRFGAGGDRESGGERGVLHLEGADQRQLHFVCACRHGRC